MATYQILGIEETDGERCECCGTRCPKRRIVLTDGISEKRFGSSCAALAMRGNKKASTIQALIRVGKAAQYIERKKAQWGTDAGTLEIIAGNVCSYWCNAVVYNGEIVIT